MQWVPSLLPTQVPLPPVGRVTPAPPLTTPQLFCDGKTAWAVYVRYVGLPDEYYVPERTFDGGGRWTAAPEQWGRFANEGGVTSPSDAWFTLDSAEGQGLPGVVTTTDGGSVLHNVTVYPQSNWQMSQGLVLFASGTRAVAIVWEGTDGGWPSDQGRIVATDNGGTTWYVVSDTAPGP